MFDITYTIDTNSAVILLGLFTAACAFSLLKKGIVHIICGSQQDSRIRLKGAGLAAIASLFLLSGLTTIFESEKVGKFLGESVAGKTVAWFKKHPAETMKKK